MLFSANRLASIPPELGNLAALQELWLRNNRLTELPPQIGNLSNLTFLSLFDNRLTNLPSTIGQLNALIYLGLRNNQLTALPTQLGSLNNLEQPWVRDNQLTEVPPAVTQLTKLQKLSFYGNQLTEVPAALGQLTQLQDLRLIKNQLIGLPEELTQLPALQKLSIYDNRIDLNDIARFLTGPDSYTYTSFEYRPQESSPDTINVSDPTGAPTLDPYPYRHPQSLFQWQRQVNGTWQNIAGATQATYTVEASSARYYRCRLTSEWLDNMIQYSAVYDVSTPPVFFLEAECATVGTNWQAVSDVTASAGSYLVYPQGNSPNAAADQVRFSVTLEQPGDFYVLARVRTPTNMDDSFWVRVDQQPWIKWTQGVRTAQWAWKTVRNQPFALGAGSHTITVAYREDGAQLDKLSLSVSATAPAGVGETDEQCVGQPLAGWQEAECATYGSYWDRVVDQGGASNQSVLQANTAYSGGLGPNDPARLVEFVVETPQPGAYHLFARHYQVDGPESSFSVRVNEGPWVDWTPAHGGSLSWSPVLGTALVLEGGSNTITFRNRFKDSQLDKLFTSSEPTLPTGVGGDAPPCINTSTAYRDQINQVFANVDPAPITTGLLRDYGLEFANVGEFDGVPADSNATNLGVWRFVYGSLFTMQFNPNANLPELSAINERISEVGAGPTHALVALHVPYQQFRSDATSRGLTVNGEQLSVGNTGDPYETKFAFAAAPEQTILEGARHTFVLARDLFIDRSGKTVDRIDVDPGIGIFRTIQPDQPINVIYPGEGEKLFKVEVSYTDGTSVESHSPLYVSNLGPGSPTARFEASDTIVRNFPLPNFPAPDAHLGAVAGATVTVEYGRAAMGTGGVDDSDQLLDKPFIVVEGFDAWRITDPDDPRENFSFEDFIGAVGAGTGPGEIDIPLATGQTLNDAIEDDGYDLVFVDFDNGTDYIERNAFLVENIIEWVNAQKPAGADENVVLGMSMGGLVARFALRDMEMNGDDHQTRLYISHDAPHQGANVPVAAQAAVTHLASASIGLGVGLFGAGLYYNISFADLNKDLDRAARLLREPATRQLVQYGVSIDGQGRPFIDNTVHNAFMERYRRMGYPENTRNVAIASGSECAIGQAFAPYATLLDVNDGNTLNYFVGLAAAVFSRFTTLSPGLTVGSPLTTKSRLRLDIALNALPDRQSQQIYQGRVYIRRTVAFFIKINTEITDQSLNSLASMLPLDSSPGGIFDISEFGDLPDEVVGIPLEFTAERFSFVPTTSALDIGGDGRTITTADLNARYSPGTPTDTPFENYFTNPAANEQHIQFTLDNGQWMLNEMQGTPTTISCLYACGDVTTFPTLSGPEEVCSTETYQVQNTGGLPIQWRVTSNLSIVGSSTGTSVQVQPDPNTNGTGRVRVIVGAPIGSNCAVELEQEVAIDGPTPLVTPRDNRETSGSNQHTATAELLPGTTPGDYVWYEDVNNQPGAQLATGLTLNISVPACTTRFYLLIINGTCGSRYRGSAFGECPSSSFTLAPNPAEDHTVVRFNPLSTAGVASLGAAASATPTSTYRVVMYSPQQEKLLDQEVSEGELRIDTRSLANGYYPVHVYAGGELVLVEQLIVER